MWQVLYGDSIIYDPRDPNRLALDMKGEVALNETGSFTFTLPPIHPLCGKIRLMQKDEEVCVLRDGEVEFCGRAIKAEQKFTGSITYTCEGERAYLNDVTLPPYSNKQNGNAPSSVDGLFNWYIAQYNLKVPEAHRFIVGVNEGAMLDKNNVIFRENSSRQNVWAEIKEKLIDKLGGWVYVEHVDGLRYIHYLADGGRACAQKIELGTNLLDFTREKDHTKLFTKLIPVGKSKSEHEESELTIDSAPDGMVGITYEKRGNAIYDLEAVKTYGIIEQVKEFSDITSANRLVDAGLHYMTSSKAGDVLELTAVDLHLLDPGIDKISLGSYVRARSIPHGLDEYFLCTKKPFVVGDPKGCKYVLGNQYDTLTGQQTERIRQLNATINKAGEVIEVKAIKSAKTAASQEVAGKVTEVTNAIDKVKRDVKSTKTEIVSIKPLITESNTKALEAKSLADALGIKVGHVESSIGSAKTQAKDALDKASIAAKTAEAANNMAGDAYARLGETQTLANSAVEKAKSAFSRANEAFTKTEESAKVATNFLGLENGSLVVGNMQSSRLGKNVCISAQDVMIRDRQTPLARFSENKISLGMQGKNSEIDLSDGLLKVRASRFSNGGAPYTQLTSNTSLGLLAPAGEAVYLNVLDTKNRVSTDTGIGITGDREILVSGRRVDIFGEIRLNGKKLADTIEAQGESGGWTWRKWSSGLAEMWKTNDFYAAQREPRRGDWAFPFSLRDSNYQVLITRAARPVSAAAPSMFEHPNFISHEQRTDRVSIYCWNEFPGVWLNLHLYIVGRWK